MNVRLTMINNLHPQCIGAPTKPVSLLGNKEAIFAPFCASCHAHNMFYLMNVFMHNISIQLHCMLFLNCKYQYVFPNIKTE